MTPQERINNNAAAYRKSKGLVDNSYKNGCVDGYIAGATAEHDRAQVLVDALEFVIHAPATWDKTQLLAWVDSAIAKGKEALEQWKSGKGKEEPPTEYMPIHPEDARKSNCPKQFPMHLLDEGRAFSNHSQSLKRLKERGGLSVREILAIVGNKPWSYYGSLPWDEALKMLNEIINPRPADKK